MLTGSVNVAENSLEQINIQKQKLAQNHAQQNLETVRVKSVKPVGKADVYNMEVDNHHNFMVDGGFFMHNCIDATRYAFSEDMKPVPNKTNYNALKAGFGL